jgi:hypothetical protein
MDSGCYRLNRGWISADPERLIHGDKWQGREIHDSGDVYWWLYFYREYGE